MVTVHARARIDFGRLVMVPGAAAMLVLDVMVLTRRGSNGSATALRWPGAALVCSFYALVIWCYLRRGPAVVWQICMMPGWTRRPIRQTVPWASVSGLSRR